MISESRLQANCYTWFHNTYAQYRGLLCCNLNNSASRVSGSINKAMGVQKGRADMVLYFRGNAYHIEFKLPGAKQSLAQVEWQRVIECHGFRYHLIQSLEAFQELITKILAA